MLLLEAKGCEVKNLSAKYGIPSQVREAPDVPPKYRLNDIDLGYTPQHNGKTFMLKTSHT